MRHPKECSNTSQYQVASCKAQGLFSAGRRSRSDPWLEACVYACARLLSMGMHAYAHLHPNPPHACVRLGSGTRRGTSCVVMHRFSAGKHWWNFCLRALCADKALKGLSGPKKNVHTCARLDGEMAHTYAHLPPNTAHACARLTLVCAHASNHGSDPVLDQRSPGTREYRSARNGRYQ